MSYYGWNGKDDSHAREKLLGASIALRYMGVHKDTIIRLNDSGETSMKLQTIWIRLVNRSRLNSPGSAALMLE